MNTAVWALIIFTHVGPLGKTDSNALTSIDGFKTLQACQSAGREAEKLTEKTVKQTRFACVSKG